MLSFSFEIVFNRNAIINNYFVYPVGELESLANTILFNLLMTMDYF